MVLEIRTKSQITLPKEIMRKLGLKQGDQLEVFEKDGTIQMVPVSVYPKKYVDDLQNEISILKRNINEGKQPAFDDIDSLMDKLK